MLAFGLSLAVNLDASDSPAIAAIQWTGALGLFALMFWALPRGGAEGRLPGPAHEPSAAVGADEGMVGAHDRRCAAEGFAAPPYARRGDGLAVRRRRVSVERLHGRAAGRGRLRAPVRRGGVAGPAAGPPLSRALAVRAGGQMADPGGEIRDQRRGGRVSHRRRQPDVDVAEPAVPGQRSLCLSLPGGEPGTGHRQQYPQGTAQVRGGAHAGQPAERRTRAASASHRGGVRESPPGRGQRAARRHRAREGEPALRQSPSAAR